MTDLSPDLTHKYNLLYSCNKAPYIKYTHLSPTRVPHSQFMASVILSTVAGG